jgi:hypothetical protein
LVKLALASHQSASQNDEQNNQLLLSTIHGVGEQLKEMYESNRDLEKWTLKVLHLAVVLGSTSHIEHIITRENLKEEDAGQIDKNSISDEGTLVESLKKYTNEKNDIQCLLTHILVHYHRLKHEMTQNRKQSSVDSMKDGDRPLIDRIDVHETALTKACCLEVREEGHPLPYSCALNHDVINCLLDQGADINEKNSVGDTALMVAVQQKRLDIVSILLNRGANKDIQGIDGKTALTVAKKTGCEEIETLLKNEHSNDYSEGCSRPVSSSASY